MTITRVDAGLFFFTIDSGEVEKLFKIAPDATARMLWTVLQRSFLGHRKRLLARQTSPGMKRLVRKTFFFRMLPGSLSRVVGSNLSAISGRARSTSKAFYAAEFGTRQTSGRGMPVPIGFARTAGGGVKKQFANGIPAGADVVAIKRPGGKTVIFLRTGRGKLQPIFVITHVVQHKARIGARQLWNSDQHNRRRYLLEERAKLQTDLIRRAKGAAAA